MNKLEILNQLQSMLEKPMDNQKRIVDFVEAERKQAFKEEVIKQMAFYFNYNKVGDTFSSRAKFVSTFSYVTEATKFLDDNWSRIDEIMADIKEYVEQKYKEDKQ